MNYFVKFGALCGMALVITLLDAFVIGIMWHWFITPTFGVPVPPFLALAGMIMIPQIIVQPTSVSTNEDDLVTKSIKSFVYPLLILFMGFILMLLGGG